MRSWRKELAPLEVSFTLTNGLRLEQLCPPGKQIRIYVIPFCKIHKK